VTILKQSVISWLGTCGKPLSPLIDIGENVHHLSSACGLLPCKKKMEEGKNCKSFYNHVKVSDSQDQPGKTTSRTRIKSRQLHLRF